MPLKKPQQQQSSTRNNGRRKEKIIPLAKEKDEEPFLDFDNISCSSDEESGSGSGSGEENLMEIPDDSSDAFEDVGEDFYAENVHSI